MPIKKSLRLIFTIDKPYPFCEGGAEVQAFKLAQVLRKEGIRVRIICPSPKAWHERILNENGIRIYCLPIPVDMSNKYFFTIYIYELIIFLLIQIFSYDAMHFFGLRGLTSLIRFARFFHKPYFLKITSQKNWQLLSSLPQKGRLKEQSIIYSCQGFIAPSKELYNLILASNIPQKKAAYIPNGTEITNQNTFGKKHFRRQLSLPENEKLILFVGRLHPDKNIDFLLHAWPKVIQTLSPALLLLVGDGSHRKEIACLIQELHLDNSVRLCGFVTNVSDYLRAADLFVLPSRQEGCSNALLEAMSCGLACIAANCPGNREIIQHGNNGLLVEYGDIEGLSSSMRNLLTDDQLALAVGRKAIRTVQGHFSIEKCAQRYGEFYKAMLINKR